MTRKLITVWLFGLLLLFGCAGSSDADTVVVDAVETPTTHPFFSERTAEAANLSSAVADAAVPEDGTAVRPTATPTQTRRPVTITAVTATGTSTLPSTETAAAGATQTMTPTATATLLRSNQSELRILYRLVNMRAGPGVNYTVVGYLRTGEVVQVLGKNDETGNWFNVVTAEGVSGWVFNDVVEPIAPLTLPDVPLAATIPALPLPAAEEDGPVSTATATTAVESAAAEPANTPTLRPTATPPTVP